MKPWTIVFEIGKIIDKLLLGLFIIAIVMGIGGWIADTDWVSTAWKIAGYSALYSLIWFIWFISTFFIIGKVKKERLQ